MKHQELIMAVEKDFSAAVTEVRRLYEDGSLTSDEFRLFIFKACNLKKNLKKIKQVLEDAAFLEERERAWDEMFRYGE